MLNEPDCFDLNDWFLINHPEIYQAVKYLHPENQYAFLRQQWIGMGRPDIS